MTIMFYARKIRPGRWAVYACAPSPDVPPVLVHDHHLTYRSANKEAQRLNAPAENPALPTP